MSPHAVVNEFAKMRRLKVGLLAAVMVVGVAGLSVFSSITSPDFADPAKRSWETLLAGLSLAMPLASPLLLAVLASRQVDIEHQGNGWLSSATAGLTPGGLCRVKLAAVGVIVAAGTVLESVLVLGAGLVLGVSKPVPAGLWLGFTLCMAVTNLVLLAFHILFAAKIDNQLVGLGVGVLGTLIAVFATGLPAALAHMTPWGYYALAKAADYQGGHLVMLSPSYPSVAALAVLGAALFLLATGRFDRQEA
ncbi:ABC transporter permease [Nonomuraea sp. NPDC046802]|uniref:ABC transporter permease n=1 Tax=Nonomuraea sp. NPDC046802 TaxID=3154919 RepID=UPI0033ECB38C